jgi:hypothetical protein
MGKIHWIKVIAADLIKETRFNQDFDEWKR